MRRHDGVEIGVDQPGGEAVDAHDEARSDWLWQRLCEKARRPGAGGLLALRRDGILQIKDDGVCAASQRLTELAGRVRRNEQQRAHQADRIRMKALRRHSATSLSSWL